MTAQPRRRLAHAIGLVGAALIASGALGYALLIVTARWLNHDDYARFLTLWGVIFGVAFAMAVVEQEVARQSALADVRGARTGAEAVLVTGIAVVLGLGAIVLLLVTPLRDTLLDHRGVPLVLVLAATAGFAVQFCARGILIGHHAVGRYAALLVTEPALRLVAAGGAAALLATGRLMWLVAAVAVGSFAWIPLAGGVRARLDPSDGAPPLRPLARRVTVLATGAGLTGCLLSGYPAIVTAVTGSDRGLATLFAAISLTRIPLILVSPVQTLTVPTVVRMTEAGDTAALRRILRLAPVPLATLAALAGGFGWFAGPWAVRLMFGAGYSPGAELMAALLVSTVAIAAALLVSAVLLALARFETIAMAWGVGTVVAVVGLAASPGDDEVRGAVGLTLGSFAACAAAVVALVLTVRTRGAHGRARQV